MSRTISMRWLAAIAAGVVVGSFALTGTAPAGVGTAPVRIVDAVDSTRVAHVDAAGSLQVAGDVNVTNATLQTQTEIPDGAFNIATANPSPALIGPEDPGIGYAITSMTLANENSDARIVNIEASYGTTGDCIAFAPGSNTVFGPSAIIPPFETVHLSFTQPFLLSAQPGEHSCLVLLGGGSNIAKTIVGYRI